MIVIKFLLAILVLELFILFFLVAALYIERIFFGFEKKRRLKQKDRLSQMITDCLHERKEIPVSLKSFNTETVLGVLEAYERRFRSDDWEALKSSIANSYLLPRARKWSDSYFWEERNFSARCFALCPLQHDEKILLKLIDDQEFLVRKNAAVALTRLGSKKGISSIIAHMAAERGYGRFTYRDIILHEGSLETLGIIEEIAMEQLTCVAKHRACLSILAGKAMTLTYPFLKEDLASSNPLIRLAAVKVYARNPQIDSAQVLLACIEDPEEKVRAEAAHGLGYFASREAIDKLEQALKDPSWNVRLEAAWSLKRMGESGRLILEKQKPEADRIAYETVQYALEFDW